MAGAPARLDEGGVRGEPTPVALETSMERGTRATVSARCGLLRGAALTALALLAACNPHLEGNGQLLEQERSLPAFSGIRLSDGLAAHVTIGTPQSVRVFADSNLVQFIQTEVDPVTVGTAATPTPVLHVWASEHIQPTIPPSVVITVPSLSYVLSEDGSVVDVLALASPALWIEAVGHGEVSLAGVGGDLLEATLSDGSLDATGYPVGTAQVTLSGASRAALDAGLVTGTASGSSIVDNLVGSGPCFVTTLASALVSCHP
jgi:hypothetical protein